MRAARMTPERPSDPPLSSAWLREGPFSYTDEGEGPTFVALHGLPGSVRDYRWLAAALDGMRIVRIEQPAFGGTPRSTAPGASLAERAAFVVRAIDALGIDRFVVLGHSMGGPLAMRVAADMDDRVDGLALLASVGMRPHRLMRRVKRRPDVARVLDFAPITKLMLPSMRASFRRTGFPESTPDEAILQCMRIFMRVRFSDIVQTIHRVRAPTFLAWAEDDPLVESAIELELGRELPDGPRIAFDDGGHNIQKSRAIELAAALTQWRHSLQSRSASLAT